MSDTKIVKAAVAVLQDPQGLVLLAERPEGKGWAGWWEFPGGKIEAGETPFEALQREMQEELGTHALEAYPWITRTFSYPEKTVQLHFFRVKRWDAPPHGKENQRLCWQDLHALTVSPVLPANTPILEWLKLPDVYAISHVEELGEAVFLQRLQQKLQAGLRLLQLREKALSTDALASLSVRVRDLCHQYGAKVLLNGSVEQARAWQLDGVHWGSQALMSATARPQDMLCAASCHNAQDLAQAAQLGLDFVVLSPVLPTLSHPEAEHLGWAKFAELIAGYALPVYALGGMQPSQQLQAWQHGAHGIAMLRAAWQ